MTGSNSFKMGHNYLKAESNYVETGDAYEPRKH